jgi:hypothetical protein
MSGHTPSAQLKERDLDLLSTLALRVRVLSVDQVARTWWPLSPRRDQAVRARLKALESHGWLERFEDRVHPELPLEDPLVTWQPGQVTPDFSAAASAARGRWIEEDVQTTCCVASHRAGRYFGGHGGRRPRRSELTHDVHLAAVYLAMRAALPTRAASWISEAALPKGEGVKVPDAVVRDGRHRTAIEFGGAYTAAKLEAFHENCLAHDLGYEVW